MTKLIELKAPKDRFARSINVERDSGSAAVDGYLPVGRAIESIDRLASALIGKREAALSITGPYGSGKSSLALVLDSLFAPKNDPARQSAEAILYASAPEVLATVRQALEANGADRQGFIRAIVTAQREPVARTVVRALHHGLRRFTVPAAKRSLAAQVSKRLTVLVEGFDGDEFRADTRQVRDLVRDLTEIAPVLLLIDEFGKNLEAFAEAPGEGDLFLLQELAEWTRKTSRSRLALVTLQHMAFGDYAESASGLQRREWVKIQGRFEDIPFVDTPAQTRSLIAAAFEPADPSLDKALDEWVRQNAQALARLGLNSLANDVELIAQCWPLHPLALAVLPDLCHRYGQNERTMFSFLASQEPRSVGRFLTEHRFSPRKSLPCIGLHRLYDYFIESAANMVGVSADASRWIEIDTRIRDSHGLSAGSMRVLKSVGLLNLVSTGGSLRASRAIVCYAAADGNEGTEDERDVALRLAELERDGLITFRDFADEFRVWQGSDFDLKAAITRARRRLKDEPPEALMQRVMPLGPVVAARHSHTTGTLRAFERRWVSDGAHGLSALTADDRGDGLVAYVLGPLSPVDAASSASNVKPVVFATSRQMDDLLEAAREVLAIDEVLATDGSLKEDWVVRKELAERRVAGAVQVRVEFEKTFGPSSQVRWAWMSPRHRKNSEPCLNHRSGALSAVLSEVAEEFYTRAIPVNNDLMNRHELSSQAAKARREVAEVMASRQDADRLGIDGFGPDMTLYLSLFRQFGMHDARDGAFAFHAPDGDSAARPVWDAFVSQIRAATDRRLNVGDLYRTLALPPYGLRQGIAPLLLITVMLVHADEFALYEHGSFRPRMTADVCERLLRNPGNFEVKGFGVKAGPRALYLRVLASALDRGEGVPGTSEATTVVSVVSKLVSQVNMLPEYSKKTRRLEDTAVAIRTSLLSATEPDVLLFDALPRAVGADPIKTRDRRHEREFQQIADSVAHAMSELRYAYPSLTATMMHSLVEHLRPDGSDVHGSLVRRSTELRDKILDPRVKALATALSAEMPDEDAWLAYVAMQVSGVPPEGWVDEDLRRFQTSMRDLGSAFLRVEALTADMRAVGGDFEALRIAVNSTRGGDFVRLLPVDRSRIDQVDAALDGALTGLTTTGLAHEEARDLILSRLLEKELERIEKPVDVGGGTYAVDDRTEGKLA